MSFRLDLDSPSLEISKVKALVRAVLENTFVQIGPRTAGVVLCTLSKALIRTASHFASWTS
eukprot:4313935-Pleurochrysis_carterae.AAC.1